MHMWGSKSKRKAKHQQGMTLLEITISIATLAMVATACFGVSAKINAESSALKCEALLTQATEATIEAVKVELQGSQLYYPAGATRAFEYKYVDRKVTSKCEIKSMLMPRDKRVHQLKVTSSMGANVSQVEVFVYDQGGDEAAKKEETTPPTP